MGRSEQKRFVATEQQRHAIEHVRGPMLVVAGAGTGKTSVLSRRIAHLIHTGKAEPHEILAVTYTRNAAAELMGRVAQLLYPDASSENAAQKLMGSGLEANTFHAYCYDLLEHNGVKFDLIDEKDLYIYIRQRIAELKLEYFVETANLGKFLDDLLGFFERCQDELRTPADYAAYVARLERGELPLPRVEKSKKAAAMPDAEVLGRCREIARIYKQIEEMLAQDGLGTFGHIITRAVDLLGRRDSVLQRARERARFILIDEFQDSNVAQIQLAKLLGGDDANVFAVGDPDQGIYRFRGASSEAFDQFLKVFGVARVKRVTMSANRRSTPPILRCAYEAIRHNPGVGSALLDEAGWPREQLSCERLADEPQLDKALPVQCVVYRDREHLQEAEFIADSIETLRQEPHFPLNQIAVLYAQHHHRNAVLSELRRRGIPSEVKGVNLFETPEVRDALAALRVLDASDPVAVIRVAALEHFEVDGEQFRTEMALAGRDPSPEAVLEKVKSSVLLRKAIREARLEAIAAGNRLAPVFEIAQRWFRLPESTPLRCLREFVGIWMRKPKPICGEGTLREFLDYVKLFREAGGALAENNEDADPREALAPKDVGSPPRNAVQLMTIHSAKGLEFRYVFVMRVTTSSLPANYREPLVEFPRELRTFALATEDGRKLHEEEQRRLFYVAMTRAKDVLYLSARTRSRKDPPPPPKTYLEELVPCRALRGSLEYRPVPSAAIPVMRAAAARRPRISEWMELPARKADRRDLSPSAIEQYNRCPLAYKLKYDWRIPEEAAAAFEFGGAIHQALKAYFDGVKAGRPLTEEAVVACFLELFSKAKVEEEEQRRRYEQDGRDQLLRFLRSPLATPEGEIIANEQSVSVAIGEITLRGRIDRIERLDGDRARIVDYKTGKPKGQEDADKSLQLSVYAMAARKDHLDPVSLTFVNLRDGTAVESSRTPEELRRAEGEVAEAARKIAAGEFEPTSGGHCRFCSYHSLCPLQESSLVMPAIVPAVELGETLPLFPA